MLANALGGCCGLGPTDEKEREKDELVRDPEQSAPTRVLSAVTSKLRTITGTERNEALEAAKGLLAEGAVLKLLRSGGGDMVRVVASADGSMLTYQALELENNLPKHSGAIALSEVHRVESLASSTVGAWLGGAQGPTLVIHHSSPTEQLRLEAATERMRDDWVDALDRVRLKASEVHTAAKTERKLTRHAAKELELMSKQRAAEKRKAEIMKSMPGGGGMKHAAAAMISRT